MITTFFIILSAVWCIRLFVTIISFSQLWYIKEYRFDRMLIHLKTPEGRRVYFPVLRRPGIRPKSILFISVMTAALFITVFFSGLPLPVSLLVYDIVSFPFSFLVVGLLNIPVYMYHRWEISRATAKLRAHDKLLVAGITGSYGKTSTKDFLATILSGKKQVIKTQASKNGPVGIAEVVLSSLTPEHDVFVAEMGAYKKGEIAQMCRIVRPRVGIVTAINAQHQDLFGSIENTMKAKYELVAGLSGESVVVLNADDKSVCSMGDWAKADGKKVWWYTVKGAKPKGDRVFSAKNISVDTGSISFSVTTDGKTARVKVPLTGRHFVSNVTAAIAGAVACGMTLADACAAAETITPVAHTLSFITGEHATYIDDTFNNNPDAALAALDELSRRNGRKMLVFQPMIELGVYAHEGHERVGKRAARICDAVILTNRNWQDDFLRGVRSVSPDIPVAVLPPKPAAEYIREHTGKEDTVLFKGKEAANVLRQLSHTRGA